jgi:hypothetical protein
VGVSAVDGDYLTKVMSSRFSSPQPPVTQAKLDKRGFLSFAFDGHCKFARTSSANPAPFIPF